MSKKYWHSFKPWRLASSGGRRLGGRGVSEARPSEPSPPRILNDVNSQTLAKDIASILAMSSPTEKAAATRALVARLPSVVDLAPRPSFALADIPGREERPILVPPAQVQKRSINRGTKGRFALLHALAHIELNAINLALDIALRFGCGHCESEATNVPLFHPDFTREWLQVADDEAKHFLLLHDRLIALGGRYGDLPAHDGLWESAIATKADPKARLAVVPMVLEARGLDVTPMMIEKFTAVDDQESVEALEIIYADEVGHVDVGRRWFEQLCDREQLVYEDTWQELVKKYFKGMLKRPFNKPARSRAGMEPPYYEPLADWYEGIA